MAYDILIKSGTVIDGSGEPPKTVDLGIDGDEISFIGNGVETRANTTINASGKYVVPGFIDITNHSDTHLTLFKYPYLESLITQGITTIIGGNCGSSLAPLASKNAINSIRKWADPSQINIDWATTAEFLTSMENFRLGVNFGTFIGYETMRRGVIGDEPRILNSEEREKVKFLLREGIKQGAFGLSLGLSYGHERVSTTEEIIEIARVLQENGGVLKVHLRSEGQEILASVNEVVRIGREIEIPIQISHLKAVGKKSWPYLKKALDLIEAARASGVNINFDVSPYRTTGSRLYLLIPAWARAGGLGELFKKLDDRVERQKVIEQLKIYTLHYDKILISSAKVNTVVGQTVAELAEKSGLSPEETLLNIVRANEGQVGIINPTVAPRNTALEIKDKNSLVASDGEGYSEEEIKSGKLVHPRSFGAFAHFWHLFVKKLMLVSPEEAVKKMTSAPAEKLGLQKRGVLKTNNFADIVIFDPETFQDHANYKNPFQYSTGVEWVIINGKIVIENGKLLGVKAGRVLRKL